MEPLIQSFIRDILFRLQTNGFPEAICVGGAIRDIDNNKPHLIKDIDVVIFDRPGYLRSLKLAMDGFQHRLAVPEQVANYLSFENVVCVHEFWEDAGTTPIQILVMKEKRTPLEILERHDFGLCQAGFNGTDFHFTEAYDRDRHDKTFTLVRCRDTKDYWRSVKRYQRLETKYVGYPLVYQGRIVTGGAIPWELVKKDLDL
jgi:hypothetical protein